MTSFPPSAPRRSTPEAGISPHPEQPSREHGAHYMQQWQVDQIRKAEGQYMNGKGPIRSFQANAPKLPKTRRRYWLAIVVGFAALIALMAAT